MHPGRAQRRRISDAIDWPRARRSGFTLIELLVSLAIIAILVSILVLAITGLRAKAASATCLSNLRQIHSGFLLYAADNRTYLPDPFLSNMPWEAALGKYIGNADLFRCASDSEIHPVLGSSYDWRDTGDASTTLAGRRLEEAPSFAVLAFEALPGWHSKGLMNYVRADGVAMTAPSSQCLADIQTAIRSVERSTEKGSGKGSGKASGKEGGGK